jgi:hypothetical protein
MPVNISVSTPSPTVTATFVVEEVKKEIERKEAI